MGILKTAVLLTGLLVGAFPAESWAEDTYNCEYSKMENNSKKDFGYDTYEASSKEEAEKKSREDHPDAEANGLTLECTKNE
ncbi:hypothetical protein M2D63_021610 [Pseudomonas sp. BJa5]|uniref:hypothetical protein n=1 Tax=Pseudomonas sp. BJa5 TaxID=2936270 RepID=UPI002559C922|nr:hypothetical protein [Pseudomonas sp. BGr12]MDL2423713.1 hypothetical protein [Pseudomonas sp. BGr12]